MKESIFISFSEDELKTIISESLKEGLSKLDLLPAKPTEYLTRKEVAKLLQVSLPTLANWTKEGRIPACRLGSRIRYRRVDIDKALCEIITQPYKKDLL